MKVNFKDPNPGVFFHWPVPASTAEADNAKGKSGFMARALSGEMYDEIMDKATISIDYEYRSGTRYEVRKIDEKLRDELIWEYCITGWWDMQDRDGEEIKYSKDNLCYAMRKQPNIANLFNKGMQVAGSEAALEAGADLKNFFTS